MIETTTNKVVYVVGSHYVYTFPLPFFAPSDIHCYLYDGDTETELVRGTDFTVEAKDDYSHGANITLNTAGGLIPPDRKLAIIRNVSLTQTVNLPEYGKLPSISLEMSLDKLAMGLQQLYEELTRCVKINVFETDQAPMEVIRGCVTSASAYADSAHSAAREAFSSGGTISGGLTVLSGATISGRTDVRGGLLYASGGLAAGSNATFDKVYIQNGLYVQFGGVQVQGGLEVVDRPFGSSGVITINGEKVATELYVREQIASSEVDYSTVRQIAKEVVSSGGHTVTALNTYSGGILVSSGGTIRGGGAIYDGLTVAGSVAQADEHIEVNPLFFKVISQTASAGVSGASFVHGLELEIPRTGESSSTLISGNLLDGGRLLISNTSLSQTGEWALPSGGSSPDATVLYGGENYVSSRFDVFYESWYRNPYGEPDNYTSVYISGTYLYSAPGHSGAWVFSGSASAEEGNIDSNGEITGLNVDLDSSGIITSDAERWLGVWRDINDRTEPSFIQYGKNFGSISGDIYCSPLYPGEPHVMSGAVVLPDPEFLMHYSSSGLVEPTTSPETTPWGSQSVVLSVSGALVAELIPTGIESHTWINSTCVSGGGIYIEGAAIDYSSKTISGELQETLHKSSGGIARASGGAMAMYTGLYYSSGSVIVDRRAELGINVAGAATITVYSSGGSVSASETVATQEWVSAKNYLTSSGGSVIAAGEVSSHNSAANAHSALFAYTLQSNTPFTTIVGDYRVALTSSGGLVISGGGMQFQVSSGAIIASGASGESVVLSDGTARLANNYDYICQYIEVSQSGITISAADPGRDINLNCYPGNVFVNSRPVLTALPTSTDSETTSASFPVLSGGTSYVYTQPLTALTFGSITSDCRAEIDFTAASGAQIGLPSGAGIKLLGLSSLDSGVHYLVAVDGARVVVNSYTVVGE